MSAISLTAASIRPLTGAVIRRYVADEALTVGQVVYVNTDGEAGIADGNVSAAKARAVGIAVESYDGETSIAAGDPVSVVVLGPVSGFSSATPGSYGYVSDTAGSLDTAAGTYSFIAGYFETAGIFFVNPGVDDPTSA